MPLVFNLESPITREVRGFPAKINLKAEENHIRATFGAIPIAVSLANNHIMDYGEQGLADTMVALDGAEIKYFGAGSAADAGGNPLIFDVQGVPVALMGYAAPETNPVFAGAERRGAMPLDVPAIVTALAAARRAGARRAVVSLHWGAQNVYLPKPEAVAIAHQLIDAGADLVVGHHAHCIQAYEVYRGKHVFYGLGNCIFPELTVPSCFDGAGRPTGTHHTTLHRWGRLSLAVSFDVMTAAVGVRELLFDGTALRPTGRAPQRYRRDFTSLAGYERKFKRSFAYGKLTAAFSQYASRPKLPRPRHLATLLQLMFKREFHKYE